MFVLRSLGVRTQRLPSLPDRPILLIGEAAGHVEDALKIGPRKVEGVTIFPAVGALHCRKWKGIDLQHLQRLADDPQHPVVMWQRRVEEACEQGLSFWSHRSTRLLVSRAHRAVIIGLKALQLGVNTADRSLNRSYANLGCADLLAMLSS